MDRAQSPTLNLVVLSGLVFVCQLILGLVGSASSLLALSWPIASQPWTLVTNVFAHASLSHLLSNMVGLALFGLLLERQTSDWRLYGYFVGSGAVAGLAEISVAALLLGERAPGVLGASGAIFAMLGYLLTSNRLTDRVLAGVRIPARIQLVGFLLLAAVVTISTWGRQVAVVAHFSGLLLGLLAGRAHLLRPDKPAAEKTDPEPW